MAYDTNNGIMNDELHILRYCIRISPGQKEEKHGTKK
jgi:hypothetical protein